MVDLPDLRPLSFGELLDRTFVYFRKHFWLFAAIMAAPQVVVVAVTVIWEGVERTVIPNLQHAPPSARVGWLLGPVLLSSVVVLVAYFVLYAVALGATTFAVSEIYLGRTVTARAAYRHLKGRYGALLHVIASVSLRSFLVFLVAMVAATVFPPLVIAFGKLHGTLAMVAAVLLSLLVIFGAAIFAIRFVLRYGCAIPALLLEKIKAGAAIKRSIILTQKNLGRVFLVGLLMTLVTWVVSMFCTAPFMVGTLWMSLKRHTRPPFWLTVSGNIAGGVGHVVTGSLLMIGLVLLYYDFRVRKEGFDLQVMMAAVDGQAPAPTLPLNPSSSPTP